MGRRIILALTILCILLIASRPASAVSQADTTLAAFTIVTDSELEFLAIGTFSTLDRTDPPEGVHFWIMIPTFLVGTHWDWQILHSLSDWRIPPTTTDNGARDALLHLSGHHIDGPHKPPALTVDTPNNWLQWVTSKPAQYIPFRTNTAHTMAIFASTPHPTNRKAHRDLYGAKQKATALKGPPHWLTGGIEIRGKHTLDDTEKLHFELVMGSSDAAGTYVSYDAGTLTLRMHMGAINILNGAGSITPGIDAAYLGDPILNAQFGDVVLPYLGPIVEGGYRFGGANMMLVDPEGDLHLDGDLGEYQIHDTSRIGVFDSYAPFDSMGAGDVGECASTFMDDFVDIDFLGRSVPTSDWLEVQGIALSFVTSQNLALLTAGFTASAFNVPATVTISAVKGFSGGVGEAPDAGESGDLEPSRNYPNPFTAGTTIHYNVAQASPIRIEIFDSSGRLVRQLVDLRSQPAGEHSVPWDGRANDGSEAPAGIYFYRLVTGQVVQGNRITLVR